MQNVGIEKFKTIVTDNGANLRVARRIIHEKYPYILDLRYMTHAINLITSDFAKIDLIKNIISNCDSIIGFFNNSHIAHGYYKEQLHAMKIKGGEIQSYCKTRWDNHLEVITNRNVLSLLQDEEFYSRCYQIASILKSVKKLTNILESRTANLVNCFIGLIRLEFINNIYILAYWLHPLYRGFGLKQTALNKIYETASIIWHNLGYGKTSCLKLLTEMRSWKRKSPPYNINYDRFKEIPMKW
ncbi:hypothetical protein Glove_519g97 [Diversispora epigaea]|uniref:DUF659 domain-containing protein n=1 Tax=Diversispora epigaea TaxID=1348612 RepID=A0A397GF14_9GLOM|nr:hypothetical protein Glove_519g97 [Diversispora epigaea]